jgi:F420-0:gamma-glutamyl ligase
MPGAISNTNGQSQRHFSAVREQLKACLSSTTPTSTFMHQGTLETYTNPGIKIKGVDKIGLPLLPRDIDGSSKRAIERHSARAPKPSLTKVSGKPGREMLLI